MFSRIQGGSPQSTKTLKDDYMDKILSRGTDPLGLKENPFLKKLLAQPDNKWAIRSGYKHVLQ